MAEILVTGLAGTSAAASIMTITDAINGFREGRVRRGERERHFEILKQEIDNLRGKIPEMFRDTGELLGYKDLHKHTQEFLILAGRLETHIHNAYEDKARALAHIEDLYKCIMAEVFPVKRTVVDIVRQRYPFLKKDNRVTRHLYPISDMLDDMHHRVESAWTNRTTKLDDNKEVKGDFYGIFGNLASLMRYLDDQIKVLSENMNKELNAFETQLNGQEG